MARNKYPEVTVNRILDTATQLFFQKGYDNTTIQDILDALGDLSKGAIYHHFKSKEEIFLAIDKRYEEALREAYAKIYRRDDLNALEKLRAVLHNNFASPAQRDFMHTIPNMMENSRFLAMHLRATMEEVSPEFVEPLLRAGMEDGSIHTENPKELAEILTILFNMWINPLLWHTSREETLAKVHYLAKLLDLLGLPLLDADTLSQINWMLEL